MREEGQRDSTRTWVAREKSGSFFVIRKKCVVSSFAVISSLWRDSHFERVTSLNLTAFPLRAREMEKKRAERDTHSLDNSTFSKRVFQSSADTVGRGCCAKPHQSELKFGGVEGDEPSNEANSVLF